MEENALQVVAYELHSATLQQAVDIYASTWERDRADCELFFTRYATHPAFRGYVAFAGDQPVGMGFGHRAFTGNWWYDRVMEQMGERSEDERLLDAWILVELAVLPEHRGMGVGSLLHDTLLESTGCRRALLSTEASNTVSRRMYENRAWTYLHHDLFFAGVDVPFVVMGKELV